MAKRRLVVKGERVQDIGYRLFLLKAAESLGLRGFWAENIEDYVEVLVEGDDDRLTRFVEFARTRRPELARVGEVVVEDYGGDVMSLRDFRESFHTDQLGKMVDIGLSMLGEIREMKNDIKEMKGDIKEMKKGQDLLLEKTDEVLQKQDVLIGEMRELKKGQDVLIGEVKELRNDLKAYMDERFRKLEVEIDAIKEKIGMA